MSWILCGLFMIILTPAQAACPVEVLAGLPFLLEYGLWRSWHQALLYTPQAEPGCHWAIVRFVKCLSVNGIAAALSSSASPQPRFGQKLGVMVLTSHLRRSNYTKNFSELLKRLHDNEMNTASTDWIVTASTNNFIHINKVLNDSLIRFDQNIIVGYIHKLKYQAAGLCDSNFFYKDKLRSCHNINNPLCKVDYQKYYFKSSERFRNLTTHRTYTYSGKYLPLIRSGNLIYNYSNKFEMENMTRVSEKFRSITKWTGMRDTTGAVYLTQYFKVRPNSTVYGSFLGSWDPEGSMSKVDAPFPAESRTFLGEELVVGRCNSSDDGQSHADDDDGPSAPGLLEDVLVFITARLNASSSSRYYSKLGFRSYEGAWTGLLGGLVEGSVDVALEPVTDYSHRYADMDFIFPIAETMCNIYIRHQETSTVRDIFVAPFSARLVLCVVGVALIAAAAVALVSRFTPAAKRPTRHMDYAEALLWSTGILCQQGGNWTPPSPSGSTLLIVCLLFAVVTYNSYAAFITSVLSVRVASVDTIEAVLRSPDFKIGYIKNGADQMYLMSTKDAQLNAFYIRGYSSAENLVSSASEGLSRAVNHNYAFFAGQRAARSGLQALSQARGRCALRELQVPSTRAHLAFPLPKQSPYARPILVSLLGARGGGALGRLGAALVPAMPHCTPPTGFASARAADVSSAMLLLAAGMAAALTLGVAEFCWKNKKNLRNILTRIYKWILTFIN